MKHIYAVQGKLIVSFLFILCILNPLDFHAQVLPAPYNFQGEIVSGNPDEVLMTWDFDLDTTLSFQFFICYVDSVVVGTNTSQEWPVSLSAYNSHCYWVAAYYDQGYSDWTGPLCGDIYPPPYNVFAYFTNDIVPMVDISWDIGNDSAEFFIVERNGIPLGTTTAHNYIDYPPEFINYCYTVFAVYSQATSEPGGPSCTLGFDIQMVVTPDTIEHSMDTSLNTFISFIEIENVRDFNLYYEIHDFTGGVPPPGFIVEVADASGTIPPNDFVWCMVTWSSEGYASGSYYQDLIIESSDPINQYDTVTNIMHVNNPAFITGVVLDTILQIPVPNTRVWSGPDETHTDINGEYFLSLDPGSHTVSFKHDGIPGYYVNAYLPGGDTSFINGFLNFDECTYYLCVPPQNVMATIIDQEHGIVELNWEIESVLGYYFTVLRRNDSIIAIINNSGTISYFDTLPEYGSHQYELLAVYTSGYSEVVRVDVEWFPPGVHFSPDTLYLAVQEDGSTSASFEILNNTSLALDCIFPDFNGGSIPTPGFLKAVSPTATVIPEFHSEDIYVSANAAGYLPGNYYQDLIIETSDPETAIDTIVCHMEVFIPGYLSGRAYRSPWNSGDTIPVFGVNISAGSFADRTLLDGSYHLLLPAGEHIIVADKAGNKTIVDTVLIQEGMASEHDFEIDRKAEKVSWITATLDDCIDPITCIIEWGRPIQSFEFIYDDGIDDELFVWNDPGYECAVRITPGDYPAQLNGVNFFVGNGSFPDTSWIGTAFLALVYDQDGSGLPGNILDSAFVTVENYYWNEFDGLDAEIDSGDFFLSLRQLNPAPFTAPIGADTSAPLLDRSYVNNTGSWSLANQDWMIRGELTYPTDSMHLYSIIGRLYDFDPELGPGTGTLVILNNVTGTTYHDNDFDALPDGWYAYAIQSSYNDGQLGKWASSNVVGKGFNRMLELNISDCLGKPLEDASISLFGQEYPYDTIVDSTDNSGFAMIGCVSMGEYDITVSKPGYEEFLFNADIESDTLFDIVLDEIAYPPQNLWVDTINAIVHWEEPLPPAQPISYFVYLDGVFVGITNTTDFQYSGLVYGQAYTSCVSANYSCLTSEMICVDFISGLADFGTQLPVNEDWSSGSFGTFWTAEDHWEVNGQFGNPYPCAEFRWDPVLTNYEACLTSGPINGVYMDSTKQVYLDGQFMLAFDLAFENNGMSGTEFLKVDIWSDDEWINLAEYSNAVQSFDFENEILDITEYALGHIFKIRFMAEGENSANILSWFVDNIEIYHYCAPPLDLMIEPISYPELQLSWYPPEATCSGYNVYLSVDNDPFQLIANTLDTTYIYNYEEGNWICFVVTAIYESCESEFSDAACTWVGIDEHDEADEIWIYPNPANTKLNIECPSGMDKLYLLDLSGKELYCRKLQNQDQSTLDVSAYEAGIYLLRIDTDEGCFVRKIIIAR